MTTYDNLTHFMEHVSLLIDNSPEKTDDAIRIMTLHSAKGLEFDYVFLPGWEEGIFPHSRALAENGDRGLEEERRLAYVGITRARYGVYISYTMQRRFTTLGKPTCLLGLSKNYRKKTSNISILMALKFTALRKKVL